MKGKYWLVLEMIEKRIKFTEIARKYHNATCTIKKYTESDTNPTHELSAPKPSKFKYLFCAQLKHYDTLLLAL